MHFKCISGRSENDLLMTNEFLFPCAFFTSRSKHSDTNNMRALPSCMFLSPHDFCACSFQTCAQTTCKAPDLVIQVQTGCPCMSHALQVHNPKSKANLHCNLFRLQCGSLHTFSPDHPWSYVRMLCILPLRAMQTFPQPAAEQKHFSHSAGNRFSHFHTLARRCGLPVACWKSSSLLLTIASERKDFDAAKQTEVANWIKT